MIKHKNIDDYLEYCRSYPDKINTDRKNLIRNIVEPVLHDDTVFFDVDTYEKCIKFCEGNYYKLFPYQKFLYAFVFMYRDDIPVFPYIVIVMGRGNGKDGLFMPLMNFLQTPIYGIKNYHVDIIANNEEQAKNSFNVVYDCLESNPSKFKQLFYWTREVIQNKKTGARLRYNTSNAKTKDGKQSGAIFFNEYHAYENYQQVGVFTSQLGKIPHARTFIVSTQGYFRDGPMDDLMVLCREICRTGDNELGYFPFICTLDSEEEVDRPESWIKANPSIEFMPVLANQIKQDWMNMKRLPSLRPEFVTKRMNLPDVKSDTVVAQWSDILSTTYSDIERRIPIDDPDFENDDCIIAIDFADIRDFASAGKLFKKDGVYYWRQKTWICRNSPFFSNIKFPFANYGSAEFCDFEVVDSKSLSAVEIIQWCEEQMKHYNVRKIVMDTYRFSLFREGFEHEGIPIESKQNPYGLVRMIRHVGSITVLTAPIIEQAFVNKKINFGPSAIMRWYTNNTSVSIDKMGNKTFGKIEPKLRKNDGFMAFVAAMSCEQMLDEAVIYV